LIGTIFVGAQMASTANATAEEQVPVEVGMANFSSEQQRLAEQALRKISSLNSWG